MPIAPPRWRTAWTVALGFSALAGVAPILLPGGEVYLDNAPHLVEVEAVARTVLPLDHSFTGWTDLAELGFAVGQINAPLAWTPLSALVALGVPAVPAYLAAIVVSNLVFAAGYASAARRLLGDPRAAAWATLLLVTAPADLWGISGAAGGMWPFRLAAGVFFWGVARDLGVAARAAWLAALLLLHTYVGVAGVGWLGVAAVLAVLPRGPRAAAGSLAALGLGLGLAAFFWLPLTTPGIVPRWPLSHLMTFTGALSLYCVGSPDMLVALEQSRLQPLGGIAGLLGGVLTAYGLVRARWVRPTDPRAVRLGVALGGLAVVVLTVPLVHLHALGPNPWRYLALVRGGLGLVAGLGLARVFGERGFLGATVALGLAAGAVGFAETTTRTAPETDAALTALDATWTELAAAHPTGWVYHDDPALKDDGPPSLRDAHPGALLPLRTGLPVVGSWYGVSPIATINRTSGQGAHLFGVPLEDATVATFAAGVENYGIGAVITASPALRPLLEAWPGARLVADHPPFAAWVLAPPDPTPVTASYGRFTTLREARGDVEGRVDVAGTYVLRRTWHPWWTATLDGAPIPVVRDPATALVAAEVPGPGTLRFRWVDQGGTGVAVSALALVVWCVVIGVERRTRTALKA